MSQQPIQGYDVSVTLVGPNGPELVGEFQECDINIKNDTETYLEMNERISMILDGEITIDGKLKKGWINMDIVQRVYGTPSMQRGVKIPQQPRFTMTTLVDAPQKGLNGQIKLLNVIIPELSLTMKSGKAVVDSDFTYKAEGIA
ncbi:hypothetical protein PP175_21345 [Aneurinibacillus sp. Ricciae_BoGa-3]|uniref:hypothetical protein n=1 Tax=Aneurinibacillus sp. Ricciae_BoGa-3 TaxID=3022697 RepID=UPI0023407262|nr:hypothetical protein [Aneurinibacillus sp. Ricciae_BoGa-3]WCK53837.1 hypothetical protein PP175_21345 [Aneurinibacillus sp. Ricciae_BoGa-3]